MRVREREREIEGERDCFYLEPIEDYSFYRLRANELTLENRVGCFDVVCILKIQSNIPFSQVTVSKKDDNIRSLEVTLNNITNCNLHFENGKFDSISSLLNIYIKINQISDEIREKTDEIAAQRSFVYVKRAVKLHLISDRIYYNKNIHHDFVSNLVSINPNKYICIFSKKS